MPGWLAILLVVYGTLNLSMIVLEFLLFIEEDTLIYFLPNQMHKHSEMNYVGCWISSIVMLILFPVIYIPQLIYYLFHLGRKK